MVQIRVLSLCPLLCPLLSSTVSLYRCVTAVVVQIDWSKHLLLPAKLMILQAFWIIWVMHSCLCTTVVYALPSAETITDVFGEDDRGA